MSNGLHSNFLDRFIANLAPSWAVKRARHRAVLAAYEAARPSRLRKYSGDNGSGDAVTGRAGTNLRAIARHLDQNHDLAHGILNTLVANIIGPNGIGIEPLPRTRGDEIHEGLQDRLLDLWKNWALKPETTFELDWPAAQRLACRTWLRDGETLAQILEGQVIGLEHGTAVPFSLELMEPDFLPMDFDDPARGILQGVERNAWGRPRAYHLYKQHPGDLYAMAPNRPFSFDTKRVAADRILHLKLTDRLRQARGVSLFASVLTRLEDLKDYEESERVAARVAAAMAFFIKKGTPDMYMPPESGNSDRHFKLAPGMGFDSLLPGEDVGTIESNRPSALLEPFRNAMLRAVSAGTSVSYSSSAKDYNGTYSAQRQELVEQNVHYQVLCNQFVGQFVRPVWQRFVRLALVAGLIELPPELDPATLDDAEFRGQAMPWIDPVKEAKAGEMLVRAGFASQAQMIRARGGNPADVINQIERERKEALRKELVFTTDPANDVEAIVNERALLEPESEGESRRDSDL